MILFRSCHLLHHVLLAFLDVDATTGSAYDAAVLEVISAFHRLMECIRRCLDTIGFSAFPVEVIFREDALAVLIAIQQFHAAVGNIGVNKID